MNTVKLSIATVELIEAPTWGMQEIIKEAFNSGVRITGLNGKEGDQNLEMKVTGQSAAKYKAIELCVKKITLNDGSEIKYSNDWVSALSIEDGNTLFDAVDVTMTPKKKS